MQIPRNIIIGALAIAIAGFFIYAFNLHNGLFWDDNDWIVNNKSVHAISWEYIKFWFSHNTLAGIGLKSNYFRPFLFLTFAINYVLGGENPLGYHLFSNLVHIINGLLLFFILNSLINKGDWRKFSWISFLTAFAFTIHPLQTEAVAYISGRGDLLVTMFMLMALWFFIKDQTKSDRTIRHKFLAIGCLTIGLFSRETAIVFPFLAVVTYITFLARGGGFLENMKKAIRRTLPYFATVFMYGLARLTFWNFNNTLNFYEKPNIYSEHLYVRLFTFLHVLLVYFKLLFIPVSLHMERDVSIETSLSLIVVLSAVILVGLVGWLYYLYNKELRIKNYELRIVKGTDGAGRNPRFMILDSDFRVWFFGLGWFFAGLGPVSGITPISARIYEHWLYLPMIGIFFITSYYLSKLLGRLRGRNKIIYVLVILGLVAYSFFFSVQGIRRNIIWGKPVDFYSDIIRYEPDSVRINNNLGNSYFDIGDKVNAEKYYRKAIESEDIFPQPHYNIASILESRGDTYGAIAEYRKAIEINPNFYYSYQSLAVLYAKQGDLKDALEALKSLEKIQPQNPVVEYNLALVYVALGDRQRAIEHINAGLRFSSPETPENDVLNQLLNKLQK